MGHMQIGHSKLNEMKTSHRTFQTQHINAYKYIIQHLNVLVTRNLVNGHPVIVFRLKLA